MRMCASLFAVLICKTSWPLCWARRSLKSFFSSFSLASSFDTSRLTLMRLGKFRSHLMLSALIGSFGDVTPIMYMYSGTFAALLNIRFSFLSCVSAARHCGTCIHQQSKMYQVGITRGFCEQPWLKLTLLSASRMNASAPWCANLPTTP